MKMRFAFAFSQLPIEVWMEILDFLRGHRRELAAKFNQFGDYMFSEFYQHWLHKYTKNVRLGLLTIEREIMFNKEGKEESNGLLKVCFPLVRWYQAKRVISDRDHRRFKVPFADVPLPENVTGCKELQIRLVHTPYTHCDGTYLHHSATWTPGCSILSSWWCQLLCQTAATQPWALYWLINLITPFPARKILRVCEPHSAICYHCSQMDPPPISHSIR